MSLRSRSAGRLRQTRQAGVVLVLVASLSGSSGAPPPFHQRSADRGLRAFTGDSVWNRQLPPDAAIHPRSEQIISFLRKDNTADGCILLAGAEDDPWGTPVYWADARDPDTEVLSSRFGLPPEFSSLRIPRGAKPMRAQDREMVVIDPERDTVAWLNRAERADGRWRAAGGSIARLSSDGVAAEAGGDYRNTGTQRGLNGAVVAVRHDAVEQGAVRHVLRVGVRGSSEESVWPMTGSDGTSTHPSAPPQGTRLRLKASVRLVDYSLDPQSHVIATALQDYGLVIADTTGAGLELKLEDTVSSGRGQLWEMPRDALCALPIDAFEVLAPGVPTGR